jgi:hypothetical protein
VIVAAIDVVITVRATDQVIAVEAIDVIDVVGAVEIIVEIATGDCGWHYTLTGKEFLKCVNKTPAVGAVAELCRTSGKPGAVP